MVTTSTNRHLRSYHFSLGDSTDGAVGYCARVIADSAEAAVARLRAGLEDLDREQRVPCPNEAIDYLAVYFNPAAVSADAIDEVDDTDAPPEPEEAGTAHDR